MLILADKLSWEMSEQEGAGGRQQEEGVICPLKYSLIYSKGEQYSLCTTAHEGEKIHLSEV